MLFYLSKIWAFAFVSAAWSLVHHAGINVGNVALNPGRLNDHIPGFLHFPCLNSRHVIPVCLFRYFP